MATSNGRWTGRHVENRYWAISHIVRLT